MNATSAVHHANEFAPSAPRRTTPLKEGSFERLPSLPKSRFESVVWGLIAAAAGAIFLIALFQG